MFAQDSGALIRPPVCAGTWYPGDRAALEKEIDSLLAKAAPPKIAGKPIAVIAPHAGSRYSAPVAATGYRYLRGQSYKRVIVMAFMFSFTFVAYLLSAAFQRVISKPISSLAQTMKVVSTGQDYSVRVRKHGNDELGVLIDGFNEMLEQIQARDERLERYREELEDRVAQRTSELSNTNHELEMTVERLNQAKEAAEAASRAKSQFLANMSHEIRTPMNGVLGMAEILLGTGLSEKQRNIAETVRHSGENLMKVLKDILDFSKIEAGKLELECVDFDLRDTVEGTVQLFGEQAQKKGVELICEIRGNGPIPLHGDPGRLQQILSNLIGNALKFTDRGEVVVRGGITGETADSATVGFTVSDTGIGISHRIQKHIFDSFTQADGTMTRKYGGTGLGLAICKQLCGIMGGEISVESEPDRGSTFRFSLVFEKQTTELECSAAFESGLKGARVLIVDDSATNRQILHHQIVSWGMGNGCAEDGYQALEMLYSA
ncbi:MAG: AmmeMemoRadiSam system protein B, partial [Syntrophobacteraceae bacterium]|nr:AmmeMemoRadiSam system protein B [Syntrophobacteraceae bacterium]